jgi:hypothetical protein
MRDRARQIAKAWHLFFMDRRAQHHRPPTREHGEVLNLRSSLLAQLPAAWASTRTSPSHIRVRRGPVCGCWGKASCRSALGVLVRARLVYLKEIWCLFSSWNLICSYLSGNSFSQLRKTLLLYTSIILVILLFFEMCGLIPNPFSLSDSGLRPSHFAKLAPSSNACTRVHS